MLELARYEAARRLRGTLTISALVGLLGAATVGFYPSVAASGVDFEAYAESLPPAVREAFGFASFGTVEGFLATEFYAFAFVLLLGLYLAYAGGRLIAAEVESGRLDLILATGVSRRRVVVERALSLVVPIVAVNAVAIVAVALAVRAIGESIPLDQLLAVHLLSVPYLLCCGAVGVVLSTLTQNADVAQRAALGLTFGLYVLDSVSATTEFDWIGAISPTRHFAPTDALVMGEYDLVGAAELLAGATLLVALAAAWFSRVDLPD